MRCRMGTLHERKRDERCNGRKIYTRVRRSDAAENAAATVAPRDSAPRGMLHVAPRAASHVFMRRGAAWRSGACRSFISRTREGLVMCSTSALWVCTSERVARLRYRACCLLPGVWCLLSVVCCMLPVVCCTLHVVCRMRSVACCTRMLPAAGCLFHAVRRSLSLARCPLQVAPARWSA